MKNTNIKLVAFTAVMGLFLSACGGGGGGDGSNPLPVAVKVPHCGTAADGGKAIAEDVTGKTIEKVGTGAEVRIWHFPEGEKKACMIKGDALIVDN